jgi:hypothetical protein
LDAKNGFETSKRYTTTTSTAANTKLEGEGERKKEVEIQRQSASLGKPQEIDLGDKSARQKLGREDGWAAGRGGQEAAPLHDTKSVPAKKPRSSKANLPLRFLDPNLRSQQDSKLSSLLDVEPPRNSTAPETGSRETSQFREL